MKARPILTLCAAITADGKLDASAPARPTEFAPQPEDVLFNVTADQDPAERLRDLRAQEETRRVLCFGETAWFRRLFEAGLVDEVCLLVRPMIDGRQRAATLSGVPPDFFPASVRCRLLRMEVRGDECLLHYRVSRTKAPRPAVAENEASSTR